MIAPSFCNVGAFLFAGLGEKAGGGGVVGVGDGGHGDGLVDPTLNSSTLQRPIAGSNREGHKSDATELIGSTEASGFSNFWSSRLEEAAGDTSCMRKNVGCTGFGVTVFGGRISEQRPHESHKAPAILYAGLPDPGKSTAKGPAAERIPAGRDIHQVTGAHPPLRLSLGRRPVHGVHLHPDGWPQLWP